MRMKLCGNKDRKVEISYCSNIFISLSIKTISTQLLGQRPSKSFRCRTDFAKKKGKETSMGLCMTVTQKSLLKYLKFNKCTKTTKKSKNRINELLNIFKADHPKE